MRSTARIAKAALALLAALAATGCESKEDRYLADLEARVAKLEETVQAGDRAAYDDAEQAVSDFLAFKFADGSQEAKAYDGKFRYGDAFRSDAVQAQIAALKDRANETATSAPAQGEAALSSRGTKERASMWSFPPKYRAYP